MNQTDVLRALATGACGFLLAALCAPLWRDDAAWAASLAAVCAASAWVLSRSRAPAPASADAEPVLDKSALCALRALGDDAFVREVADQFVMEGRLLMLRIAQATAHRNAAEFAAQTHALRSSAANIGARRLYALCLAWRAEPADALSGSAGAARLNALEREFQAACDALRAALAADGARPLAMTPMAKAG